MPSGANSCPWCGAKVGDQDALCPSCMRSPQQHPSLHARGAKGPSLDLELALDTPKPAGGEAQERRRKPAAKAGSALELELPQPAGSKEKTARKPAVAPLKAAAPGGLDDDGWDAEDLDIGLDLGADVVQPTAKRKLNAAVGMASRPPAAMHSQPPGSRSLPPEAMEVAADAVAQRADYGKAPAAIWAAPLYAWRVYRRRRELVEELKQQRVIHREADRAVRDKLRALVDELVAHPKMDIDGLMGEVEELGALLDARKATFATANEQLAAQLAGVDQQLNRLADKRAQLEADRKLAKVHRDDCDQKQQRAARAMTELSHKLDEAHEAARREAPGAEFAPPEHARRIAALEQRRQRLDEQLNARREAAIAARGALRDKKHQLRALDKQIEEQIQRRQQTEQQTEGERQQPLQELEEARLMWLDAYDHVLARIALERPKLIDDDQQQRIARMQQLREDNDRALAVAQQAVDAYDEPAYKRGVAVIVVTAVLLSLLLLSALRVS